MSVDPHKLEKRVKKLRKMLRAVPKDPTVEQVHDLRTRTRRVESALEAVGMHDSGNERKLLAGLKRVRSRAGKVRDMDVLMSHVLERTNSAEAEQDCVIRLAHHLGVRRYRQAGKLHSTVKRDEAELRDRLRRVEHRLSEAIAAAAKPHQALDAGHGDSNDEPLLHMVAAALRLSQELAAVPRLGPKNLHSYRIEVKRLRYVLEMADEAGERQKKIVEELRNVQDRIGDWHDWVELHAIAEGLLQHDRCKLIAEIRRVEKQKFQQALKTTEQMRQRYLQLPPSGNKRAEHSRPSVPLPALAASAQIAA